MKVELFQKIFWPTHEGEETFTKTQTEEMVKTAVAEAVAEATKGLKNQEGIDRIVEERLNRERNNRKEENEKLIDQLKNAQKQSTTTKEERDAFELQIQRLQDETQTKAETAARDLAEVSKKHDAEMKTVNAESKSWRNMFSGQMVETAIRAAATEHEATSQAHDQLVAILGSMDARIDPITDEGGKDTGGFKPVVTFDDKDADGKAFTNEAMVISEAVKRMKEMPDKFGNLFKETMAGGVGGDSGSGNSGPGMKPGELDPKAYQKARAEGKLPHQQG